MLRLTLLVLSLLFCAVSAGAGAVVKTKVIGEVQHSRSSASYRLEISQPAGLAIIYDRDPGNRRVRLLTADGRLTELRNQPPGNTLFDKYVWNERESALYLLGNELARFNPASREFIRLRNGPKFTRDIEYVPRWGTVVLSGADGLYKAGPDGLTPVSSRGIALTDVVRVTDLPRFKALLLETIDKAVYIRTDDGILHPVGRLPGRYATISEVVELQTSSAIQVLGSGDVEHIEMAQGSDDIWRPTSYRWYSLGTIAPMINGYVPQLDAMVVWKPGWSWLDWWFDRSGLYKLTENGLLSLGDWSLRPRALASLTALSSTSFSLYRPHDPIAESVYYRLDRSGRFTAVDGFSAIGQHFNVHEVKAANQLIVNSSKGLWHWDGTTAPRRLNDAGWSQAAVLPLTQQLLVNTGDGNILVGADGKPHPLGKYQSSEDIFRTSTSQGEVFQAAPARWFEIGSTIREVQLDAN